MVTIDGKRIAFSTSLMIRNDQEARVDASIEGTLLKLGVTFESGGAADERSGAWKQDGDVTRFTFRGWNNPLGTCILEPTKFGEIGSKRLFFQISHHYVGEQNLMHLFIYVEQ